MKSIIGFPFRLGNTKQLVMARNESSNNVQLLAIQNYMKRSSQQQLLGFGMAYQSILMSIASGDEPNLKIMMEPRLYERVQQGMQTLNTEQIKLKFAQGKSDLNRKKMKVDIIDYNIIVGAEVLRDQNQLNGLLEVTEAFKLKNFKIYTAPSLFKEMGLALSRRVAGSSWVPEVEKINLELVVQITSDMSLHPETDDKSLQENFDLSRTSDTEIHFLKFEGKMPNCRLSPASLRAYQQNFEVTEWTVTDLDNCLEGNPHI